MIFREFVKFFNQKAVNLLLTALKLGNNLLSLAVPCLTSTDTAKAIVNCIESGQTIANAKMVDMATIKTKTLTKILI